MSLKALRHAVDSGRWRRLQPGVFSAHSGPPTPRQRLWAAVLACGGDEWPGAVGLGGLSALCTWGLTSVDPHRIQVLVSAGRRDRALAGVDVHRAQDPPLLVRARDWFPPATLSAVSLVDAVRWSRSDAEARLIIAASFQQRIVVLSDVERVVARIPNLRRRALLRQTAVDCAGGSHSIAELELLTICRRAGLPEPTRQLRRNDQQGRVRYIDAVFEPWRVVVEVDGAHHLEVGRAWDDALRANALELDGYTVLRYPAFTLRTEPSRVTGDIRQALLRAGWQP